MGWLFIVSLRASDGKLMVLEQSRSIVARHIDIVSLDPFVKSHSVEENLNTPIDAVAQILTDLATEHDIAVDAPHHTSKGAPEPGNANRGRGASSMKDAARLVYTLTPMTSQEAEAMGVPEAERRSLVRMDSGKVNIAPSMSEATWFRLVGVPLGNVTERYPNGDNVQTVKPWTPPKAFSDCRTRD